MAMWIASGSPRCSSATASAFRKAPAAARYAPANARFKSLLGGDKGLANMPNSNGAPSRPPVATGTDICASLKA